jgi:hypothetical protein
MIIMGTKETYDELLQWFYSDAEYYSSEINMTKRRLELVKALKDLGLFCFYHDRYYEPAVTYRGHTFVFDMVEPFQLGFYADIATFDKDDYDVGSELHAAFNNMNWTQFLAYVYEVDGIVVISSSQYVGTRKINQEEVVFMLQSMDEALREFHKKVGRDEYLNDNVTCI